MLRAPEDCRFRKPIDSSPDGSAVCELVGRLIGVTDPDLCLTRQDACQACCRSVLPCTSINPVIASLVYHAASRIVQAGGTRDCGAERAQSLMRYAIDRLGVILETYPDRCFPPEATSPNVESRDPRQGANKFQSLTWAVGLLTAPRKQPTIARTIGSLYQAGFEPVHVFAEPDSWVPSEVVVKVTVHQQRLGNFVNFYTSLSQLLREHPTSDAVAVFQDDIEVARGLKAWCDRELWPEGTGVVSLFTPRVHQQRTKGWHLLSPGSQRICGAQALIFRRDVLERFLADPSVMRYLDAPGYHDDAVLAGWVAREGMRIAYHTPSLVQHIGNVSSLFPGGPDARNFAQRVSSVELIQDWKSESSGMAAIGLIGWNTATGLGYQNRDLATHLGIDRWLVPHHPARNLLDPPSGKVKLDLLADELHDNELRASLRGLDWILFSERPYLRNLVRVAAHAGIGVACIPNWEWVHPEIEWLGFVDLMLCPTRHTYLLMEDWKRRYGFGWETVYVPWPIDVNRFHFRERLTCERFLFVNGWGGGAAFHLDGTPVSIGRKGIELVVEAARLAPELSFIVHSLEEIQLCIPSNVDLRPPLVDNVDLYRDGDVCVQPSRYEGIGLQLLECQAAGMPLVTTDAPPMNEYQPWRKIPVHGNELVNVGGGLIASQVMRPVDLVDTLLPLRGLDLREPSHRAREFIVREHSWERAIDIMRQAMCKR